MSLPFSPLCDVIKQKYATEPGRVQRILSHMQEAWDSMGEKTMCSDLFLERGDAGLYLTVQEWSKDIVCAPLHAGRYSIGRDGINDIILSNPFVSCFHGSLTVHSDQRMTYRDWGSRNGTRVSGLLVQDSKIAIRERDILFINPATTLIPIRI